VQGVGPSVKGFLKGCTGSVSEKKFRVRVEK